MSHIQTHRYGPVKYLRPRSYPLATCFQRRFTFLAIVWSRKTEFDKSCSTKELYISSQRLSFFFFFLRHNNEPFTLHDSAFSYLKFLLISSVQFIRSNQRIWYKRNINNYIEYTKIQILRGILTGTFSYKKKIISHEFKELEKIWCFPIFCVYIFLNYFF